MAFPVFLFRLACVADVILPRLVASAKQRRLPCSVPEVEYALRLARRMVIANQGEGKSKTHFR